MLSAHFMPPRRPSTGPEDTTGRGLAAVSLGRTEPGSSGAGQHLVTQTPDICPKNEQSDQEFISQEDSR